MPDDTHAKLHRSLPKLMEEARTRFYGENRVPATIILHLLDENNEDQAAILPFPDTAALAERCSRTMHSAIRHGKLPEYAILADVRYLAIPDAQAARWAAKLAECDGPPPEARQALLCYYASPQKEIFYIADVIRLSLGASPQVTEWRALPADSFAIAALPQLFIGLYARSAYGNN